MLKRAARIVAVMACTQVASLLITLGGIAAVSSVVDPLRAGPMVWLSALAWGWALWAFAKETTKH